MFRPLLLSAFLSALACVRVVAAPLTIDPALANDKAALKAVQENLNRTGIAVGKPDGAFSAKTKKAFAEFLWRFAPDKSVLSPDTAALLAAWADNISGSPWERTATDIPFTGRPVETEFDLRSESKLCAAEKCKIYTFVLGQGDVTGDGKDDLVVQAYIQTLDGDDIKDPQPIVVLTPTADGHYERVQVLTDQKPGLGRIVGRDAVVRDFNGDGFGDVFIAAHGWDYKPFPGEQNVLLLSTGDGKLRDVSLTNIPVQNDFAHGADGGDLDGDGDQDLIVITNGGQAKIDHYVLFNDGTGKFTKKPLSDILTPTLATYFGVRGADASKYVDVTIADIDGDRHLDLLFQVGGFNEDFVSERTGMVRSRIAWGDGSGRWTRDATQELPLSRFGRVTFTPAIALADLDGDGDLDLIAGSNGEKQGVVSADSWGGQFIHILRNDGARHFTDVTTSMLPPQGYRAGAKKIEVPRKIWTAKLNDDATPDIVISTIADWVPCENQRDSKALVVYLSGPEGRYRGIDPDSLGLEGCNVGANLAPIDFDGDGDDDLVGTFRANNRRDDGLVNGIGVGTQVFVNQ